MFQAEHSRPRSRADLFHWLDCVALAYKAGLLSRETYLEVVHQCASDVDLVEYRKARED
jgi:hypothetical protein